MARSTVDSETEYDERRAGQKRREITRLVKRELAALDVLDKSMAAALVGRFVTVTPPALPPVSFEFASVDESGGTSVKPGNIIFNVRKFLVAVAEGAVGIAGAPAAPWALVVSMLLVLQKLYEAMTVEIGRIEAIVLLALSKRRNIRTSIRRSDVVRLVNRDLTGKGGEPVSRADIDAALAVLEKLRCIAATGRERIRLHEKVSLRYR